MILVAIAVFGALLVGLATGGDIRRFPSIHIRAWWLAVVGLALQLAPISGEGGYAALLVSLVLLLVFAWINLRVPGFILIAAGLLLNALVISLNHGMPVTEYALTRTGQLPAVAELRSGESIKHRLADDGTLLLPLSDAIGVGGPIDQAVSIGDVAIYLGVGWFVVGAMRPRIQDSGQRSTLRA
jgi:Family of unknown function (DUF5317)